MTTPFYDDGTVTIFHGDCRDVLSDIVHCGANILLTDPPYGIDYQPRWQHEWHKANRGKPIANDADPDLAVIGQAFDLLRLFGTINTSYVFCNWRSIRQMWTVMAASGMDPKACIVWVKNVIGTEIPNGGIKTRRFSNAHEFILYAGPFGGERHRETDVWHSPRDVDVDHPTPKPVSLLIRALDYADAGPDSIIIDPFMGSGSTLRAAKDLGCRAIGIEREERFCEIAARRLGQGSLFEEWVV